MTKGLPWLGPTERHANHLRSMAFGTLNGTVKSARPFKPKVRGVTSGVLPGDPDVIVEYDGANLVASEGAEPTEWPDTGPNGWDALPNGLGSAMDYEGSCIGGEPGVRSVSGSRDFMYEPISPAQTNTDFTAMMVVDIVSGQGYAAFLLNGGTAPDEFVTLLAKQNDINCYTHGTGSTEAYAEHLTVGLGAHLVTAVRNSEGLRLRLDGAEVASDLTPVGESEWDFTTIRPGAPGGAIAYAKAWAGELVDLAGTEADLMTRFGL